MIGLKSSMKINFFMIFLCWILNVSFAQEEVTCKGHEIKITDHQKAEIADCLELAGIKSLWKIPAEKLSCFGTCILEKKDMLTPDGRLNHEKALKFIEASMPAEVSKPLIEGVDKCIKDHGDKVKEKDDPKCLAFVDVGQCVHDVFMAVCM